MSIESQFKIAIYQAARIGFDSAYIRIPLYGCTATGERIAVLDGRLRDRYDRVGFLILRAAAAEDGQEVKIAVDRSPVDTVVRDPETQSFHIPLRDYGPGLAAGVLALHIGDDYPGGSTLNGQSVIPGEFHENTLSTMQLTGPESEITEFLSTASR